MQTRVRARLLGEFGVLQSLPQAGVIDLRDDRESPIGMLHCFA